VFEGAGAAERALGGPRQAVLALAHMGNWDLAGAWATRHLAQVVTVAERLEPEEVFQDFLAMRTRIGLKIVPLEKGVPAFRRLLREVRAAPEWIACLLAERDLGRGGVEVTFFGEKALMAAGPAALALATGRPLAPVAMYRRGQRYVVEFMEPVWRPGQNETGTSGPEDREVAVREMTQAWATALEGAIRRHPADWHMLQKVFVSDLDPARLEQVRGGGT
jgi:KDO2-lipid IV(A) lauroyltransferase